MSKTYYVRINCVGFQDFEVRDAKSEAEAIERARNQFQCDERGCEFGEFLSKGDMASGEVIEAWDE